MAHMWDRGVLNASSWHGLEEVGTFTDAQSMIEHGERTGAWPIEVRLAAMRATLADVGVTVPVLRERAVVASYRNEVPRAVGVGGERYQATTPAQWRALCEAAAEAGAKPTGAFSLDDGRKVLATFEVNGRDDGIAQFLLLADSFDGSQKLTCGTTSVRVVCANTLAMAMHSDGEGMAKLRHTSSLTGRVEVLRAEIGGALKSGTEMRQAMAAAAGVKLTEGIIEPLVAELFPLAAPDAVQAA